eukprot:412905-Pelagomonas_calceolata.AAC.4
MQQQAEEAGPLAYMSPLKELCSQKFPALKVDLTPTLHDTSHHSALGLLNQGPRKASTEAHLQYQRALKHQRVVVHVSSRGQQQHIRQQWVLCDLSALQAYGFAAGLEGQERHVSLVHARHWANCSGGSG